MDALNIYGRTRDLAVVGLGNSDLDDYARDAAAAQGRVLRPDPAPEKGGFFRSDHFPFARQGVPAINAGGGDDYVGRPADYGRKVEGAYTAQHYHKPSDENPAGLGPGRRHRRPPDLLRHRLARGAGGHVARVEGRERVQGAPRPDAGPAVMAGRHRRPTSSSAC